MNRVIKILASLAGSLVLSLACIILIGIIFSNLYNFLLPKICSQSVPDLRRTPIDVIHTPQCWLTTLQSKFMQPVDAHNTPVEIGVLFLLGLILIFLFYLMLRAKVFKDENKAINEILPIITIIFVVWLIYHFLFSPHKIVGADVGPYKIGTTVITHDKWIGLSSIKPGDVVIYFNDADSPTVEDVAQIVGVQGDKINGYAYYQDGESITGVVPEGFYLIKFPRSGTLGLVSDSAVDYVVW